MTYNNIFDDEEIFNMEDDFSSVEEGAGIFSVDRFLDEIEVKKYFDDESKFEKKKIFFNNTLKDKNVIVFRNILEYTKEDLLEYEEDCSSYELLLVCIDVLKPVMYFIHIEHTKNKYHEFNSGGYSKSIIEKNIGYKIEKDLTELSIDELLKILQDYRYATGKRTIFVDEETGDEAVLVNHRLFGYMIENKDYYIGTYIIK